MRKKSTVKTLQKPLNIRENLPCCLKSEVNRTRPIKPRKLPNVDTINRQRKLSYDSPLLSKGKKKSKKFQLIPRAATNKHSLRKPSVVIHKHCCVTADPTLRRYKRIEKILSLNNLVSTIEPTKKKTGQKKLCSTNTVAKKPKRKILKQAATKCKDSFSDFVKSWPRDRATSRSNRVVHTSTEEDSVTDKSDDLRYFSSEVLDHTVTYSKFKGIVGKYGDQQTSTGDFVIEKKEKFTTTSDDGEDSEEDCNDSENEESINKRSSEENDSGEEWSTVDESEPGVDEDTGDDVIKNDEESEDEDSEHRFKILPDVDENDESNL